MILYRENLNTLPKYTNKNLEIINKYSKVAKYETSVQ